MTEELKEITPNIDEFVGKLNDAIDVISAQVISKAPEAAEAIINLVQFKGVFHLTWGFLLLATALYCVYIFFKCLKKLPAAKKDYTRWSEADTYIAAAIASACISFTLIFPAVFRLMSFENWLASIYPVGALALKALNAVGVQL